MTINMDENSIEPLTSTAHMNIGAHAGVQKARNTFLGDPSLNTTHANKTLLRTKCTYENYIELLVCKSQNIHLICVLQWANKNQRQPIDESFYFFFFSISILVNWEKWTCWLHTIKFNILRIHMERNSLDLINECEGWHNLVFNEKKKKKTNCDNQPNSLNWQLKFSLDSCHWDKMRFIAKLINFRVYYTQI